LQQLNNKSKMTKYYFQHLIYILLLLGLFMNSCNSQTNTNSQRESATISKPIPKIIGLPPHLGFHFGPNYDTSLVGQYIRCIFQDSKGNYWFGPTGQSVVRYDEKSLTYFSKEDFFYGNDHVKTDYGNSVHAIAEDKNGNIWFGTEYGVVKYNGTTFRSYTEKDGLSHLYVSRHSILVDQSGNIWLGTPGGVFRYNPIADNLGAPCFSRFDILPSFHVKDIMEDHDGNIWFASQDRGVFRFDPRYSDKPEKAIKNITAKEGLGDNYVYFWFTMKDGICRYDARPNESNGQTNTFTEYTTKDGLGGNQVWGLLIEESGIIWITARGSTTRFDPTVSISDSKAFTVFTEADGINCCVQSMYQDQSGKMWWGTGQGLYRFDGKRFYQVKQNGPW